MKEQKEKAKTWIPDKRFRAWRKRVVIPEWFYQESILFKSKW